jgi:tyrosyl-tRNA synthetase
LLRFFTFLPLDEIATVMAEHLADPSRRVAQRRLADDVTARVHGADSVTRATAAAAILFGGGELRAADAATLAMVAAEVPTAAVAAELLAGEGLPIADALVLAGLAASKGEAKRGLSAGGFSVNGAVADEGQRLTDADRLAGGGIFLRKGKKSWAVVTCDS